MLTIEEHTLTLLMEECGEAIQRASKQMRFGKDEVQPGQSESNAARLRFELNDVLVCIQMLEDLGEIPFVDNVGIGQHRASKRAKVARMMELSKSLGRLEACSLSAGD